MSWGRSGIALALALGLVGAARAQQGAPEKIFSNRNSFKIPFAINPGEGANLREVQLYSSDDWGLKWKQYASASPDKGEFVFRADQDGEYWFTVRTLDREGHLYPEELTRAQAGLKVVVDTHPPVFQLRPLPRRGPEVSVQWEARDDHLNVDSLKLEYQSEGEATWRAVPPPFQPSPLGMAAWKVSEPGKVVVRGRVKDHANNETSVRIEIPPESPNATALEAAERPKPAATETTVKRTASSSVVTASASSPPPKSADASELQLEDGQEPNDAAALAMRDKPAGSPLDPKELKPPFKGPAAAGPSQTPSKPKPAARDLDVEAGGDLLNPPAGAPAERHASGAAPDGSALPEGTRFLSSNRFALQYRLESVGPSGAAVELWVTDDRGRTWQRGAVHQDHKSPITVDLKHEGLFGITLVAHSGAGLGEKAPVPGDQPQMWVLVDTTPPQAQLKPARLVQGIEPATIVLNWSASDRNLAERPISLYYADQPDGQWLPIASGIENTGHFEWKMPSSVAYRFYLRLEVSDRAGNRTHVETPEPLLLDTARPKSRIVSIDVLSH